MVGEETGIIRMYQHPHQGLPHVGAMHAVKKGLGIKAFFLILKYLIEGDRKTSCSNFSVRSVTADDLKKTSYHVPYHANKYILQFFYASKVSCVCGIDMTGLL